MPETIFQACDDTTIERFQSDCYQYETSGLYGFAAVSPMATIADVNNPTLAEILAAELAGYAFVVRKKDLLADSYAPTNTPRPSNTEVGFIPAPIIGQDYTAVVSDAQGVGNEANYNNLARNRNLNLYFFTADRVTPVVAKTYNLSPAKINPTGDASINTITSTITFRTNKDLLLTYPSAVAADPEFNKSPVLAFDEVTAVAPAVASIPNKSITNVEDVAMTANVVIEGATSYELASGTLPAGLTGTGSSTGYAITGTPTTVGTTKIKVRGINDAGISGTYDITLFITAA